MANTGTLQGGILFTSTNGGIFLLDGVNEYISTANQLNSDSFQSFTVGAWFRTSDSRGRKIIGFENTQFDTNNTGYDRMLWVGTDGKLYFGNYSDGYRVISSTNSVNDNCWYYAVGTYSTSTGAMKLYINGEKSPQELTFGTPIYPFSGWWKIGAYSTAGWPGGGGDGFLQGQIGPVHVYNSELDQSQVLTNYTVKKLSFITESDPTAVASTSTNSTINLVIDPNEDPGQIIDSFLIQRANSSTSSVWTLVGTTTTTLFSDTTAIGGQTYYYRIKSRQSDGKTSLLGTVSNGVTATVVVTTSTSIYRNLNNEVGYYLQGNTNGGGVEDNATTRANVAKGDWAMLQGKWQDAWFAETVYVGQIRTIRAGVTLISYNEPRYYTTSNINSPTYKDASAAAYLAVNTNGAPELWKAKTAAGVQLAHNYRANDSWAVNWTAVGVNSFGQTLQQSYVTRLLETCQTNLYDGIFMDDSNIIGNNLCIRGGDGTPINWSYLQDGVDYDVATDYTFGDAWRTGIRSMVDSVRAVNSNWKVSFNLDASYWYTQNKSGGRPPTPYENTALYGSMDISGNEDVFSNNGFGSGATSGNYPFRNGFAAGNVNWIFQSLEIARLTSKEDSLNRMGRQLGFATQQQPSASNQTDFAYARACWAIGKIARGTGYSNTISSNQPVFLDETCIKLGAVIGTRTAGTLVQPDINSNSPVTWSRRAPNQTNGSAEFYWTEFENALVVSRLDTTGLSGGGTKFGDGAEVSYTLPSAGAGKKWQRPNCSTYVHPDFSDLAMTGQSPSLNNGADASTSSLKPMFGEVFLRVNA
jgi:hypothetical protein